MEYSAEDVRASISKCWSDFEAKISKSPCWILFQFNRADSYHSLPVVKAPFAIPQHSLDGKNDEHMIDTIRHYDLRFYRRNFDPEQQGYLFKMVFCHFQRPFPKWLLNVHDHYFNPTPVDPKKKGKRMMECRPEGLINYLERIAPETDYCKYTPEQFGKVLEAWYHEAFGADVFQIGSTELEVGNKYWDNHRLYLSMYGRAVAGFGYDGEPDEKLEENGDDGGEDEEDDTADFVLPEECGFMASNSMPAISADAGITHFA